MAAPRDHPVTEASVERETVYTIGHSNHSSDAFIALLKEAGVDALADVRSTPFSRYNPQFNREVLASVLKEAGVAYVWLGDHLGARPSDASLRRPDGGVDFRRLAASPAFRHGIERVRDGARRYELAMMCAERDPLNCHRTFLIARQLADEDVAVRHVLGDGRIIDHRDLESRIVSEAFPEGRDPFTTGKGTLLNDAYDRWDKGS